MANKWKVLHAFETVIQDFPCMCGAVASIRMVGLDEIDKNSEAETLLLKENGHYVIRINLNSTFFASPFFPIRLWHEKRTQFSAGCGIEGVIIHEIGHVLHYLLDIKTCPHNQNLLVNKIKSFASTSQIVFKIKQKLKISKQDFYKYLSTYGATDADESIAEGISEYYTTKTPRAFAVEVVNAMKSLL